MGGFLRGSGFVQRLWEPPRAEPHAGWCGGWRLETSGYPIRLHLYCPVLMPIPVGMDRNQIDLPFDIYHTQLFRNIYSLQIGRASCRERV